MNPILAIIPYTGSEKLVQMTAAMIAELEMTIETDTSVMPVANAPSREITFEERGDSPFELSLPKNLGFGPGINAAIAARKWAGDVLVLNNDLQFPEAGWLQAMRDQQRADEADGLSFVYAPRTTVTATWQACAEQSEDRPAQRLDQISAYCWLVPAKIRARLRERAGFELFPPEFPNYGSDDAAGAWLRKLFGRTPFQLVHRAFVRHLKGRTAAETGDKAGDPKTLKRLRAYLHSHKLTWHA